MSGHSKWAQIKRKKGAADAKRGQLFSKLSKQLTVAARQGKNLDMAIAAAKAVNMPKETIDRAIKKGTGELEGVQIEEVTYEAYGPGGAAILITALTDNRNRTISELRALASKQGLTLAGSGSVQYLFDLVGVVEVAAGADPDSTQLQLIEAGVDDVTVEDDRVVGTVKPVELESVRKAATGAGLKLLDARIAWVPKSPQPIGEADRAKLLDLMETIDELDDVSSVETNAAF